ncbi:hypothetical protein BDQ17DRAFT_1440360 [Cyathus striatus]|nr:hypothetical protein BDQ17DRAFT_1440360 [Cyathus striatus]
MPQMMNLGVTPTAVAPGGIATVTWNNLPIDTSGHGDSILVTIMPTPSNADFTGYQLILPSMTSLEIRAPFSATSGIVTFVAVESAGNPIPGIENNPFIINIAPTATLLPPSSSQILTASQISPSDTAATSKLPGDTSSSSISITWSTSTTLSSSSENSKSSIPIGVIAGCVVGAIAGIAIISLAIWFVRTRKSRSGEIHKKNALLCNRDITEGNDGVLEPFDLRPDFGYSNASSTPVLSATNFTGMAHSNPSGEVVHKRRDISAKPSTEEPPLSNGRRVSHYMPSSTPRRELDAGLIGHESQSEGEATLPPNYSDVFARSRSSSETIAHLPSTSHQKP